MDFPELNLVPPVIGTFSMECGTGAALARGVGVSSTAPASTAWPSANLAFAAPFFLRQPTTFRSAFWANGATVAGNVDVGVYGWLFNLLGSTGAVAASGTSAIQKAALSASLYLPAGAYFLAMSCSSATNTNRRWGDTLIQQQHMGVVQMASAHPLPSTFTPASAATLNGYTPLFGICQFASTDGW